MPKKLKNYEVLIKAYCSVVVIGAKNEEEAIEHAKDEISNGDFQIEELSIDRELKTEHELESAKRHADAVSEPEHD